MARPVNILIVEDVDAMRGLLETMLGGIAGVRVSGVVSNVCEARRAASRERPDLVLLDEILPGESSLDLLSEFKNQNITVLLITGMENPVHPLPPGAAGRLFKPEWHTVDADRVRFAAQIFAVAKS
jgi:response regulator of citrate/malate metabolism